MRLERPGRANFHHKRFDAVAACSLENWMKLCCLLQDMRYALLLVRLLSLVLFGASVAMENAERVPQVIHEQTAFVSKVEPKKVKPWTCDCYNATTEVNQTDEVECRCFGKEFRVVPEDLARNLHRLTITDSDISILGRDSLQPYKDTLRDVWVLLRSVAFFLVVT